MTCRLHRFSFRPTDTDIVTDTSPKVNGKGDCICSFYVQSCSRGLQDVHSLTVGKLEKSQWPIEGLKDNEHAKLGSAKAWGCNLIPITIGSWGKLRLGEAAGNPLCSYFHACTGRAEEFRVAEMKLGSGGRVLHCMFSGSIRCVLGSLSSRSSEDDYLGRMGDAPAQQRIVWTHVLMGICERHRNPCEPQPSFTEQKQMMKWGGWPTRGFEETEELPAVGREQGCRVQSTNCPGGRNHCCGSKAEEKSDRSSRDLSTT